MKSCPAARAFVAVFVSAVFLWTRARFDVVNLFDKIYELRDGRGIGVGAPQFGQRRGFYGTIAYDF
jgi:outer membrane receptor protein involved in Fe transport